MTTRGLGLIAPLLVSCSLWGAPLPDPECSHIEIDADTELLVTARWLRADSRASNGSAGPFSFAAQLSSRDSNEIWRLLDLAQPPAAELPFRLLALVNRTDLAEQLAPESPAGEARLVYTLTAGAGDAHASRALPLTVIFEYSLGSEQSAASWASAFHELAATPVATRADVAATLVTSITVPRSAQGAPYLSQVRVNDARFGTPKLYELAPKDDGTLAPRGLRNTPRLELAATAELATFVHEHADAIQAGTHRVPGAWLATSALVKDVTWLADTGAIAHDFSRGTCSGCHGDDGPGVNGFHLTEAPDGSVTRSPFVSEEELPRRAAMMRQRLCGD